MEITRREVTKMLKDEFDDIDYEITRTVEGQVERMKRVAEIIPNLSNVDLLDYATKVQALRSVVWASLCNYDAIDPSSMFVVFDESNPYLMVHNAIVGMYHKAAAELRKRKTDNSFVV